MGTPVLVTVELMRQFLLHQVSHDEPNLSVMFVTGKAVPPGSRIPFSTFRGGLALTARPNTENFSSHDSAELQAVLTEVPTLQQNVASILSRAVRTAVTTPYGFLVFPVTTMMTRCTGTCDMKIAFLEYQPCLLDQ